MNENNYINLTTHNTLICFLIWVVFIVYNFNKICASVKLKNTMLKHSKYPSITNDSVDVNLYLELNEELNE